MDLPFQYKSGDFRYQTSSEISCWSYICRVYTVFSLSNVFGPFALKIAVHNGVTYVHEPEVVHLNAESGEKVKKATLRRSQSVTGVRGHQRTGSSASLYVQFLLFAFRIWLERYLQRRALLNGFCGHLESWKKQSVPNTIQLRFMLQDNKNEIKTVAGAVPWQLWFTGTELSWMGCWRIPCSLSFLSWSTCSENQWLTETER